MTRDILVIDREEQETFWLTFKNNNEILFATTAKEGLQMLSEKVGLVFLRIRLPDMDGIEVLKQIKKEHPSVAVIIVTSCGSEETCIEAFRNGAKDYLNRPLEAEDIRHKIDLLVNTNYVSHRRQHVSLSTKTNPDENYPDIPSHLVSGVLRVRDYIAQNYSESLTLSAACKMATISKTYFCRFFKCITGHSLRSYHHIVKMHIAEELLCDKSLSITDVAIRLGYDDPNYFSTIYKKINGFSPREWQASQKNLHTGKRRTGVAEISCDNKYSGIQSESEHQSVLREWQDSYYSLYSDKGKSCTAKVAFTEKSPEIKREPPASLQDARKLLSGVLIKSKA